LSGAGRIALAIGLCLALAACGTAPVRKPPARKPPPSPPAHVVQAPGAPTPALIPGPAPTSERDRPPAAHEIPEDVDKLPDAVPQAEPRSRSGNSPVYQVLGKTYRVMNSADGFVETGYASWYGKKFHGRKTASGETYNMFAMTAAHKSLPLPSYVRVTLVETGRSIVVKVNDRGPFHKGRIIDLSYAAAAKLGILNNGHAEVRIEALVPDSPEAGTVIAAAPPAPPTPKAELKPGGAIGQGYLQVASFIDPINAIALREELARQGFERPQILSTDLGNETLHRVVIGPFAGESSASGLRQRLLASGHPADWVTP
jgi:rare lipoprotein A